METPYEKLIAWAQTHGKDKDDVIWFAAYRDAQQYQEMTTREIAEMLRDGIAPTESTFSAFINETCDVDADRFAIQQDMLNFWQAPSHYAEATPR